MIERMLQKDVLVKVTAVALALLVWHTAVSEKNPLGRLPVSVEIEVQAAPSRIVTSQDPPTAQVTFEGRDSNLAQVKPEELKITVDATECATSSITIPIGFVSPYPGVKVVNVNPKQVIVGMDDLVTKEVGVAVATRGTPNEEYEAEKPVPTVPTVIVSGPKKKVDQVQIASGEVDITGAVGAVTSTVSLVPKDPSGDEVPDVEVEPGEVDVTVPMKRRPPAKTVPVRADIRGTPKTGYRVARTVVNPQVLEIRGETSVTRQIEALQTREVDVSGRDATFSASVSLVLPAGIEARVVRATVTVEIEEDIIEKTFSNIPVQVENPPVGYSFDISPTDVDIVLTGRSDILATIKASDLQAYINAEAVDVGESRQVIRELTVVPRGVPQDANIKVDIKPAFATLTLTKR